MNAAFGLLLLCAASSPLAAAQAESVRPDEPPDIPVSIGLAFQIWQTDLRIKVAAPSRVVDVQAHTLPGILFWGENTISPEWSLRTGLEYGVGVEMESFLLSVEGAYRPGILEDPWGLYLHAGLVGGVLEEEELPGAFKPGLGIQGGVGLSYALGPWAPGVGVHVEAAARWLEFKFDEASEAVSADDKVGGLGVRLAIGLEYRF